jgi:hypothetical protein
MGLPRYQTVVAGVHKRFVRVAVLWTKLSGYLSSSLRSLQAKGTALLVLNEAAAALAMGFFSNVYAKGGR